MTSADRIPLEIRGIYVTGNRPGDTTSPELVYPLIVADIMAELGYVSMLPGLEYIEPDDTKSDDKYSVRPPIIIGGDEGTFPYEPTGLEQPITFESIWKTHRAPLVSLARSMIRSGTAADCVQDVFAELAIRGFEVHNPDKVGAYLRRAVINRCRSVIRHRIVEKNTFVEMSTESSMDMKRQAVDDVLTENSFLYSLYSAAIDVIRTLPERQKHTMTLSYVLELPEWMTAQVMGVKAGTVKSQLARGRKAVKKELSESIGYLD